MLWNKSNDMEIIISRLVHYQLLRGNEPKRALEKVKDLLQKLSIEVVH
jgi:hypothetical protein